MTVSRGWAQHTTKRTQAAEQWLWLLFARGIQTCQAAIKNPTGGHSASLTTLRNQGKRCVRERWKQGWAGAQAGCQAVPCWSPKPLRLAHPLCSPSSFSSHGKTLCPHHSPLQHSSVQARPADSLEQLRSDSDTHQQHTPQL